MPPWFRALRDAVFVSAWVLTPGGRLLAANRLAVEGCGFDRRDVLGRPFWETGWWALGDDVRAQLHAWVDAVGEDGREVRAVTPYTTATGEVRTVDLAVQRVADDPGGPAYVLVTGVDVTDRVLAEHRERDLAELRAAEADLSRALALSERVLGNVADGIYGLDRHGRVEFVNPAAVAMTGLRADRQLGADQHALLHDRRPDGSPYPREECPVWRALRSGEVVTADEEVFWRADGTPLPVTLIAVPTIEDGVVTGLVVSFRDLTDRIAAQRQAAELARLSAEAAATRALADRLQAALLTPPPEPDHLQIAVRYRPAVHGAQVGGDWYDAFLSPDGATTLVIGDVVGHDSGAAAAMGQLRGLVRALAFDNAETPAATLRRVERTARGLGVGALATAVLARVERIPGVPVAGARRLRWSNAGHLPPLLLAPDGSSTYLESRPEFMLGIDPEAARSDHTAELRDEHTLLLVTDGLVERRDADLDAGLAALQAALADLGRSPLEELCDRLLDRLLPHGAADDVAIVAVRAYPEDRPRPPEAGPNRLPPGFEEPAG
ncbi:SpoIIE family protein phosphatase [Blastococcus sp. SYSU D00820]